MKRLLYLVVLLLAIMLSCTGCSGKGTATDTHDNPDSEQVPEVAFEMINHDLYKLKYYYVPSNLVTDTEPDDILIEDNRVCAYYYLEDLDMETFENADEAETAHIRNTIKLEWTKSTKGLLKNTIERLQLKQLDDDGLYYYADIKSPSAPEAVIGKSIFWLEDRLLFNMDVPIELFSQYQEDGIKELAYVERINIFSY